MFTMLENHDPLSIYKNISINGYRPIHTFDIMLIVSVLNMWVLQNHIGIANSFLEATYRKVMVVAR